MAQETERREFDGLTSWVKDIDDTLQSHTLAEVRMEERISAIEKNVEKIQTDVTAVLAIITKARGIWGFLGWIGGLVIAVSGLIALIMDKK